MTKKKAKPPLLVGCHCSAQGGVHNALLQGQELGATTIQLFTANQRQWSSKHIPDDEVERWFRALEETGIREIMSHDSYLINLGSPNIDTLQKSRNAFRIELERCHQLELAYLNFHPGSATTSTIEECIDTIIESLLEIEDLASEGPTRLLLEATAGQGTNVGYTFEHLNAIIQGVKKVIPIGVCIDTCHIFAAGYDIRDAKKWDATLKEFDRVVGLGHLYGLHVNDSKFPLGSRKDRHANLGEGEIGIEGFKAMMRDKRLSHLPKYLETPVGGETYADEIALLMKFATTK